MSTQVQTDEVMAAQPLDEGRLSFAELVERLQQQTTPPSLEDLNEWLSKVEISDEALAPYLGFKEGNYWRHRVCRNEAVEMLVLCWRPGQRTPIHDHNGSHGAVRIERGILWESNFSFEEDKGPCYQRGRECHAGDVTGAAVPDIHQLGNPDVSGQDLVTIHIYAPPLGVLKTYRVGSRQIDLYTPNDFPT